MCTVYNSVGCITAVKSHLQQHQLNEFSSLDYLIRFRNSYTTLKEQIIINHKTLLGREKETLATEISYLQDSISNQREITDLHISKTINSIRQMIEAITTANNIGLQRYMDYVKRNALDMLIGLHELSRGARVAYALFYHRKMLTKKNTRYQYLDSNFNDEVNKSALADLEEHKRKKTAVNQIANTVYGALAELKVAAELEQLPDDCILINDFSCNFYPALFHRNTRDYIQSVQIDHLLITPAGIFIIETKNWSKYSMANPYLFSPVRQVKRANYAIYMTLSAHGGNRFGNHHWGNKKIPIRNIIVFNHNKPQEEFEFVKIVETNELRSYINWFKPCLSENEIYELADKLLRRTTRTEVVKDSW